MKLLQVLVVSSVIFLVTLVIVTYEVLSSREEECNNGKINSRNNHGEQLTKTQQIIRSLFRVVTGMAIIKIIKGLFFPNNGRSNGGTQASGSQASAPPFSEDDSLSYIPDNHIGYRYNNNSDPPPYSPPPSYNSLPRYGETIKWYNSSSKKSGR
ncbi:hypothetical protein EHEL_071750 [Encephalitozoon hellem ATCC 50504]|uniref:Uncharacterized protein n=1 Tax=Encephalitozoon hellem TaxID=27973 RepID=A0A9Q9C6V4_ENCHE|nr:uncharacterized protein EHEL_071750 [Encephalitozoon hellem ATCC 50504]AFM98697.1 hypothetical protein EHEL_071750 [Encephalitozoon hellem ATCC 50504]UTX43647.1 hypothetical protein GPU96_07g14110 [Encephalitozoon hellem]WEL39123.1 hypothetical protein PFJ87_07g02060 [Encephalitozoon hellem]|eukprot:XP_003887678.1 hypothetical protein EHEL_071750 [Encephalitozoon hellem ATCC 50504]